MLPTCQSPSVQRLGWASLSFGQGRIFILCSRQWVKWFLTGQCTKKRKLNIQLKEGCYTRLRGHGRRGGRKNVRTIGWRAVQGSTALWIQHVSCMNKLTGLCPCIQYQPDNTPRMDGEMTSRPHSIWGDIGSRKTLGQENITLSWGCGHGRIPLFQWTAPHPCTHGQH